MEDLNGYNYENEKIENSLKIVLNNKEQLNNKYKIK